MSTAQDKPYEFTTWDTGVLIEFANTVEMNRDTTEIPRQRDAYGRMAIHANWELERRQKDYQRFVETLGGESVRASVEA